MPYAKHILEADVGGYSVCRSDRAASETPLGYRRLAAAGGGGGSVARSSEGYEYWVLEKLGVLVVDGLGQTLEGFRRARCWHGLCSGYYG